MGRPEATVLDQFLDPVAECFTAEVAARILEVQPSPELQARTSALARKANEGQLSAEERAEYEEIVEGSDLLAILKAKARLSIARGAP